MDNAIRNINVYDFDGTLFKGDSSVCFCFYLYKKKPLRLGYLFIQAFFFIPYKLKLISSLAYKNIFFCFLNGLRDEHVEKLVDSFWKKQKYSSFHHKLIDEIKDTTLVIFLQNWGESTMVKDFPQMVNYARKAGLYLWVSTNFSVDYSDQYFSDLMNSGIGRLTMDIDGTTQEVYEKYRVGGNLDLVLKNIRKAVKFKKDHNLKYPMLQARMLVMKHNEHQIEDFKELAKELGVDEMELGNIQLNPNTAAEKWLPENKQYVYQTYVDERRTDPCHWPWSSMVINWDGGVSPCCIVDDSFSDFGNVLDNGFDGVWNNEYYVSARSEFSNTKNMTKSTICNVCKNDTHNPNLLRVGDSFSITLNKNVQFKK